MRGGASQSGIGVRIFGSRGCVFVLSPALALSRSQKLLDRGGALAKLGSLCLPALGASASRELDSHKTRSGKRSTDVRACENLLLLG